MVDDSIQFYWEIIAKGTIAEQAKLNFHRVPAQLQCMTCFKTYYPTDRGWPVQSATGSTSRSSRARNLPSNPSMWNKNVHRQTSNAPEIHLSPFRVSMTQNIPVIENIINANDRIAQENFQPSRKRRCFFHQHSRLARSGENITHRTDPASERETEGRRPSTGTSLHFDRL